MQRIQNQFYLFYKTKTKSIQPFTSSCDYERKNNDNNDLQDATSSAALWNKVHVPLGVKCQLLIQSHWMATNSMMVLTARQLTKQITRITPDTNCRKKERKKREK